MLAVHPQYIVDDSKTKKAVVIDIKEWDNIMTQLDMLDDIVSYDKAKANNSDIVSFDQAVHDIRSNNI